MTEVEKAALAYAIAENDRRGRVPGHSGETKDSFLAGAAWQRDLDAALIKAAIADLGQGLCELVNMGDATMEELKPRLTELLATEQLILAKLKDYADEVWADLGTDGFGLFIDMGPFQFGLDGAKRLHSWLGRAIKHMESKMSEKAHE